MTAYNERRTLPYSPEQMFDLVAGVERYPEFLPWCIGARILKREPGLLYADLIIGWKMIREKFTSKVTLNRPGRIHVDYVNGPMKFLHNDWQFLPAVGGGTEIHFDVDFEFKSRALSMIMGTVFTELVHRMVGAFEARAHAVYGRTASPSAETVQPLKQKA